MRRGIGMGREDQARIGQDRIFPPRNAGLYAGSRNTARTLPAGRATGADQERAKETHMLRHPLPQEAIDAFHDFAPDHARDFYAFDPDSGAK